MMFSVTHGEPARVCAISSHGVVEGKLTVISARVIYRLGALCDSRGLRSPTVCYPLTASALELFFFGRIQAWEGGHAYAVFQLFVRTQPRQTVVEPTVARSDSLRGCWPVDVLCTTINVEATAR